MTSTPLGDARRPERRRSALLFGLLVSGVSALVVVRGVDAGEVTATVRSADLGLLLLAAGVGASGNGVRAVRWGLLLGERPFAGIRVLFDATMIGYLANNVLPARLGELVRIYVLRRIAATPIPRAAATVVAERVLDALLVLGMVGAVALFVPLPEAMVRAGRLLGLVIAGATVLLFALAWRGADLAQAFGADPRGGPLPGRFTGALARFSDGLRVWRGGSHAAGVLALSLGLWALELAGVALAMRALDLELPLAAPLCVLVAVSLSSLVPSAPGGVGTYELFVASVVAGFAVDPSRALGLALLLHVLALVTTTGLGALSLWSQRLSLSRVVAEASEPERGPE